METIIASTIAIVIAGLSYYLYMDHLVSTRRADAQLGLVKLSGLLENYYLQHKTYKGATLQNIGMTIDTSPQGYYRMGFELHDDGQAYDALAIPLGAQAEDDKACGTLVLATDGRRSYRGEDKSAVCW